MSAAQPTLPGSGVTVRILRDDGMTFAGITLATLLYTPGNASAKLAAATGLSAAEILRARNANAVMAHQPREPISEGPGWAIYGFPGSLQAFVLRDDGTHLSWGGGAALFTPQRAASVIGAISGLSDAELARSYALAGQSGAPSVGVAIPSSGLVARWRAQDITGVANGVGVASWTDSVSGLQFAQATGASQPLLVTNWQNGKAAVQSNGTRFMGLTSAALDAIFNSSNYTVLVYGRQTGATAYGVMFGSYSNSAGENILLVSNTGARVGARLTDQDKILTAPYASTNPVLVGLTSLTGIATGSGGTQNVARLVVNGGITDCRSGTVGPPAGNNGYGLFARDALGALGMVGEIAEVVIYNRSLMGAELYQVMRSWADYYGQAYPWAASGSVLVLDGDSITGNVGSTNALGSYPYKTAQALSLAYGAWTNTGIGSFDPDGMTAKFVADIGGISAYTGVPTKVAAFEFRNMYLLTPTAAQAKMNGYLATAKTNVSKVAFGTSTTYAADTSGSPDANRAAYNAYWETSGNRTGKMDVYFQLHLNSQIGVAGAASTNPTLFSDNVGHLTDAGYGVLANAWSTALAGF